MATLDELIANQQLADDLELAAGDTKIKMGDLRKFRTAQLKEVEERRKALDTERGKVNKLAEDALQLYNSLQTQPKPKADEGKTAPAENEYDFGDDPWLGKVGKGLQKLAAQQAEAQKKYEARLEEYQKALSQGFQYVVQKDYERRWSLLNEKPADKTWNDYLKLAQDNKILDQWGLPDPIKAYEESIRGSQLEKLKQAEFARGIEEGKKAAAQVQAPRPGTANRVITPSKNDKVYADVDTLLEDAFGDQDIARMLNGGNVQ